MKKIINEETPLVQNKFCEWLIDRFEKIKYKVGFLDVENVVKTPNIVITVVRILHYVKLKYYLTDQKN